MAKKKKKKQKYIVALSNSEDAQHHNLHVFFRFVFYIYTISICSNEAFPLHYVCVPMRVRNKLVVPSAYM